MVHSAAWLGHQARGLVVWGIRFETVPARAGVAFRISQLVICLCGE